MEQGSTRREGMWPGRAGIRAALPLLAALAAAGPAAAQTDYYNLDKHRPLRIEDAYATERYAFELQAAPLTLEGTGTGRWSYSPSLEIKRGLAPGFEASVGIDFEVGRVDGETSSAVEGLELSALYNLNTETLGLPALGIRATGHVPLNGDDGVFTELRGIATRTLGGPVRAHLNAAALLGEAADERWWAGAALDYVLPFRATLLLAETWVAAPRADGGDLRVHSAAGVRHQLSPTLGLDAGIGRDWAGDVRQWRITAGITRAFGVRAWMPRR